MKYLLLILAAVTLASCAPDTERERRVPANSHSYSAVRYVMDTRTEICFAESGIGYPYGTRSTVPCTPLVLKAIAEDANYGREF